MGVKEHIHELYGRLLADKELFRWLLDLSKVPNSNLIKIMQEDPEKYKAAERLRAIFKHIEIEEEALTEEVRHELWGRIEIFIDRQEVKRRRIRFFVRYAAAFLILAGFSAGFLMLRNGRAEALVDYEQVLSGVMPAAGSSNNIILVLEGGERIEIGENQVQLLHDGDGGIYAGSVWINESACAKGKVAGFNKLYVPYGKTMSLVLNDGTKVWVNSGSKVVYPALFAKNRREIFVEGEVYLEVARKEDAPFIVKAGVLDIEVLGTAFNVSAYSCDDGQSVVLASGSVSVKDTKGNRLSTIRPNQKFTYEKTDNSIRLQDVNAVDYTGWRFGYLSFHKEELEYILKKIERFYNVRIDYAANRGDHTVLSGKLDLKENIEETFKILSITVPIDYTIGDDAINVVVKH